ncbi:deoxynucleoside kinase domain-containing protein [Phthorimaea operculella]|nr:deoxynucleoside kinase domain-containing protein [Phthorimaea operculella]
MRKYKILLEGNIASGKSSLLDGLALQKDITVLKEPIEKWQDVGGVNLFKAFSEDRERWSYTFQNYVFLTLLENHQEPITTKYRIMERSIFSAKNCFIKTLIQEGYLNNVEKTMLDHWFDFICEKAWVQEDLIVYLRTTPEIALQRISSRKREGESSLTLSYLKQIHESHEAWLLEGRMNGEINNTEVEIIDGNQNETEVLKDFFKILETLEDPKENIRF